MDNDKRAKTGVNDKESSSEDHQTLRLSHRVRKHTKNSFTGFMEFIRTQGVVGLAIGFVLATQAKGLVDQLSNSFLNPILGLVVGTGSGLTNKKVALSVGGSTATFAWGSFAYAFINFLMILAIVYFIYRWLRLDKLQKPK